MPGKSFTNPVSYFRRYGVKAIFKRYQTFDAIEQDVLFFHLIASSVDKVLKELLGVFNIVNHNIVDDFATFQHDSPVTMLNNMQVMRNHQDRTSWK